MTKNSLVKVAEISMIIIFSLGLIYLLAIGVLSSTGIDHAWPYPTK